MADASRFPGLAVPFALTGACAGWLSSTIATNPIVGSGANRAMATGAATVLALLTGALLKRTCVGRRYDYEMGDPDPELRPATDMWLLHVVLVLAAGAATGGTIATLTPGCTTKEECVLGGLVCALVFVPVCLSIIAAARRAQRARLGSIVAASDRRAVWSILAILLGVMTLEGLPDWPAASLGFVERPLAVLGMLAAAALVTVGILIADLRALSRAREVVDRGLSLHDPGEVTEGKDEAARVDLGIGEEILAQVARGAAAYRQRARTLALVKGTPGAALSALGRAVRRGTIGLAAIGAAGALHACATSEPARSSYGVLLCSSRSYSTPCELAEQYVSNRDPALTRAFFERIRKRRGEASTPD